MELAKEIEELFNEWREIPFKNESAPVLREFSEWLAAKLCSRLASRVEELEKALKFYGKHRANCVLKTFMLANDPDCTCGLKTVLAGAHAGEKE